MTMLVYHLTNKQGVCETGSVDNNREKKVPVTKNETTKPSEASDNSILMGMSQHLNLFQHANTMKDDFEDYSVESRHD